MGVGALGGAISPAISTFIVANQRSTTWIVAKQSFSASFVAQHPFVLILAKSDFSFAAPDPALQLSIIRRRLHIRIRNT